LVSFRPTESPKWVRSSALCLRTSERLIYLYIKVGSNSVGISSTECYIFYGKCRPLNPEMFL